MRIGVTHQEFGIHAIRAQQFMDQRHDKKPIRAGANTHPFIGNSGIASTHGIDGNHLGVALLQRCKPGFDRV